MLEWEKELAPPDDHEGEDAIEVLRVWLVDGQMSTTARAEVIEHAEQWGGLIADLAMQLATVFGETAEEQGEAFKRILYGFDYRIDNPDSTTLPQYEEDDEEEEDEEAGDDADDAK